VTAGEAPLAPLFAAFAGLVPGATAAVGPAGAGWIRPGQDNDAPLAALLDGVRRAEPRAGAMFHVTRSWSLLAWRPALLAVLAVHRAGLVPRIDLLALDGGAACRFPSDEAETGPLARRIALAGRRLRLRSEGVLADLARLAPIKPGLARRLLADRVLGLLALEAVRGETVAPADCPGLARRWLDAMALPDASALALDRRADGRPLPVLERRSCCLEFRAAAGAVCPSCPRLPPGERRARQRAHWSAHA
jgi:siderophore ferric iron reductase